MPTNATWLIAIPALLTIATGAWIVLTPESAIQPAHNPGHVNCPPGSHGKPRYSGVGESLERARQDARAARDAQSPRPLESRALTAQ